MPHNTRPASFIYHPLTHWTVLVVSMLFTLMAWHLSHSTIEKRHAERFDRQSREIAELIERRMLGYETALRGGAGYFASQRKGAKVSREQWAIFIRSIGIEKAFPGLLGIGFTRMLQDNNEIESFIREVRASGLPDFRIYPEGLRKPTSAIEFLEPSDKRSRLAIGYDQFSDPVRQRAMTEAMTRGRPGISGPVTLQGNDGETEQRGFLMFMPVYRNNAPISTRKLFETSARII